MKGKLRPGSVTIIVSIISAFVALLALVVILGWSFFTGTTEQKKNDIVTYVIFALIGAAISNISTAFTSYLSQKSEENRERSMVDEIKSFFIEKTNGIKDEVNIALMRSDLVSGDQKVILNILMNRCLEINKKIKRIRILAYNSITFSDFFTEHFDNGFLNSILSRNKEYKLKKLEILVHNPDIDKNHPIVRKWVNLRKNRVIENLWIRRATEKRRSFFGMVIEFEQGYHPIGLIGFYQPQGEDGGNTVSVLNNPYGVFSEEGSSILSVITEYFNRYWDNADPLRDEDTVTPE